MSDVFKGLHPASDTSSTRWFVERMRGQAGVDLVVPRGFDSYARVMHRLEDGHWADRAPEYLRVGVDDYTYPLPGDLAACEGDLGDELVDALVPRLAAATSTPAACHFGLWVGWGEFNRGAHTTLYALAGRRGPLARWRRARQRRRHERAIDRLEEPMYAFLEACAVQRWWGGRDMRLFDGPLDAVASIGSPTGVHDGMRGHGPQWWWPQDRSWFVGSEIDHPWSYIAGNNQLIDAVTQDPRIEPVVVDSGDA